MFVSKLLLGPSRLALRGGLTDAVGALRRQVAKSHSMHPSRRTPTLHHGRVHSRQDANSLVCGDLIRLQERGCQIQDE